MSSAEKAFCALSAATNPGGQATFCYTGPTLPGGDTIAAYADTNLSNTQDAGGAVSGVPSDGQLAFPVTFILTDILNEFYGRAVVRRVTYLAFAMVGLSFLIIYAAGAMPWWPVAEAPDWSGVTPAQFKSVFTQAFPEYWLYVLGLLFVLVTLFLPQGVMGLLARRGRRAA